MTSWIKVARYHLLDRRLYVWGPWAIVAFTFAVTLIITALQGGPNPPTALIALSAAYLFLRLLLRRRPYRRGGGRCGRARTRTTAP